MVEKAEHELGAVRLETGNSAGGGIVGYFAGNADKFPPSSEWELFQALGLQIFGCADGPSRPSNSLVLLQLRHWR